MMRDEKGSALIVASTQTSFFGIKTIIAKNFSRIVQAETMTEAKQKLSMNAFDLVIVNTPLADEFGAETSVAIAMKGESDVLLLVKAEQFDQVTYRTRSSGVFVLSKPLKGQVLIEAVHLMGETRTKIRALQKENDKLRKRLDEMQLVTRAKCLLIERRGMTEDEAHHYLEKDAMDFSRSKRESAQQVIRELED